MLVRFKYIIEKINDLGTYGNTIVEKLNNNIIYLIGLDIKNGLMKISMDKKNEYQQIFHVYVPPRGQLGGGQKQGCK